MKQTHLVHYYIVDYIKRKEDRYLIFLADLRISYPGIWDLYIWIWSWMVKLPSITSSFRVGKKRLMGKDLICGIKHCSCRDCQVQIRWAWNMRWKMKAFETGQKFGCEVDVHFAVVNASLVRCRTWWFIMLSL